MHWHTSRFPDDCGRVGICSMFDRRIVPMRALTERLATEPRSTWRLPPNEIRVVLGYALLGSLWIILTDRWLHSSAQGGTQSMWLQTFKGLNFIFTTSSLLYLVLQRSFRRWQIAEDALRFTEHRMAYVGLAATDAIYDWNIETHRIWWSNGFYKLFGFSEMEVEPTIEAWTDRLHPEDRDRVSRGLDDAVGGTAEMWSAEYRFRCKNGGYAYVDDRGYLIRNRHGKAVRMVGGMTDITDRKKAQEQLEQSHHQLRALSGRMECMREEERKKIAREIHDELGQMLTGLKMDLRWIESRVERVPGQGAAEVLDKVMEAGELTDRTIAAVQRLSAELRPQMLDTLGLCAAIQYEAMRFQEKTGIEAKIVCPEDCCEVDDQTRITVYRIFQEALTNIIRHSGATEVSVTIEMSEEVLWMTIADNGKGIDQNAIESNGSLGLLGMRERAALLNGKVDISRGKENGTIVRLIVPLVRHRGQMEQELV